MAIYNSAVCNCHKDDEFTPLFQLVEMGYLFINKNKPRSERISFGIKLRKAIEQFKKRFLPHMKEEEEVFQPLLMQHFTQQELADLKYIVIKLHMQQRKKNAGNVNLNPSANDGESHDAKATLVCSATEESDAPVSINQLPDEILLKVFSKLNFSDTFRAAKVSRKWNQLAYDQR